MERDQEANAAIIGIDSRVAKPQPNQVIDGYTNQQINDATIYSGPATTHRVIKTKWSDANGRKYISTHPEGGLPEYGVKEGPPSLDILKLPLEYEIRLHNMLFDNGIFTAAQARNNHHLILHAIQVILNLDVQTVVDAYLLAKE